MNQPQSQLARYVAKPSLSDGQVLAMGAKAWKDQETLVVRLNQIQDPVIRQMAITVAQHVFGQHLGGRIER